MKFILLSFIFYFCCYCADEFYTMNAAVVHKPHVETNIINNPHVTRPAVRHNDENLQIIIHYPWLALALLENSIWIFGKLNIYHIDCLAADYGNIRSFEGKEKKQKNKTPAYS